jgi:hypothetical protein
MTPSQRDLAVDAAREFVELGAVEERPRIHHHVLGVADMLVADDEGLLGGFDQPVNVIEAFALSDTEPVEHREDHQRGQALGRRRHIIQLRAAHRGGERRAFADLMALQIGGRHWRSDFGEICGNRCAELAAIEAVETIGNEALQRRAESRQLHHIAFGRGVAVRHEGLG